MKSIMQNTHDKTTKETNCRNNREIVPRNEKRTK